MVCRYCALLGGNGRQGPGGIVGLYVVGFIGVGEWGRSRGLDRGAELAGLAELVGSSCARMWGEVGGLVGPTHSANEAEWMGTRRSSCLSTVAVRGKKYKGKNRAGIRPSHASKCGKRRAARLANGVRVGHRPFPRQDSRQPRPERRQLDKEVISSPRELNSSRSGMEYLSHSGAKRRLPPAPATRTSAHGPRAALTLCFQQVNATATGISTAAHNCFIFNGCHIATGKRQCFRAYWLYGADSAVVAI